MTQNNNNNNANFYKQLNKTINKLYEKKNRMSVCET